MSKPPAVDGFWDSIYAHARQTMEAVQHAQPDMSKNGTAGAQDAPSMRWDGVEVYFLVHDFGRYEYLLTKTFSLFEVIYKQNTLGVLRPHRAFLDPRGFKDWVWGYPDWPPPGSTLVNLQTQRPPPSLPVCALEASPLLLLAEREGADEGLSLGEVDREAIVAGWKRITQMAGHKGEAPRELSWDFVK